MGTRVPQGTQTIKFISHDNVPSGTHPTYGRIVVAIHRHKAETHHTRLTVGGNLIDYPGEASTPTADLSTIKCLFNSVISTPQVAFITSDITYFYLNTPLETFEYMKLALSVIPDEIISHYQLQSLVHHDGFVYIQIQKGMYGLPQAGRLTYNALQKHLLSFGFAPT